MPGGARLVLDDGGRQMVYDRLKAVEARGKQLAAKLEVLSANLLAVVLDDTNAEYPLRIDPTFSDANWISFGGLPGTDGDVLATALDSAGNLYVGGNFTVAGNVLATNIAQWNGSRWSALGSEMNDWVFALAVSGTNLYAGGYFTSAGGVLANSIAQWNGTNWSALGSGMTHGFPWNADVNALAVSGNTLYAGGDFTKAGGVSVNYVAGWNGSSWSSLGSGVGGAIPDVIALTVSGGTLYAGGYFTSEGTNVSAYLAAANLAPPPLTLSMPTRPSSGQFQMAVNGLADQNYTVQMSTNLSSTNWVPIWVTNSSSGPFLFRDPNATNPERFYRILIGP